MERFANDLKIGIDHLKESIANVLSSSHEVLFDFDLQMLTQISGKSFYEIQDIISYLFWSPKKSSKSKELSNNFGWFDFVDSRHVVPCYLLSNIKSFVTINDYLSCVHVIENNSSLISWYFIDGSKPSDSYLMFLKIYKKKKKTMINNIAPLKNGVFNYQHHIVHVFRYSSNGKGNTGRKCLFEHTKLIESTRNPFIKLESPIILGFFDPKTSKRIFHVAHEDNYKPDELYKLLVQLSNVLKRMLIDCVVIQVCSSFNFRTILKMLRYVFCDGNIKVFVHNLRNNQSYFGRELTFFK